MPQEKPILRYGPLSSLNFIVDPSKRCYEDFYWLAILAGKEDTLNGKPFIDLSKNFGKFLEMFYSNGVIAIPLLYRDSKSDAFRLGASNLKPEGVYVVKNKLVIPRLTEDNLSNKLKDAERTLKAGDESREDPRVGLAIMGSLAEICDEEVQEI